MSALSLAAAEGNLDLCRKLLANGAAIDEPSGWPPIHWACINGRVDVARFLIESGARLDIGETNHLVAVSDRGDLPMLKLLVEAGCSVDGLGTGGKTGLMYGAIENNSTICRYLIECGANVDLRGSDGWNALMLACSHDSLDSAQLLIGAGADLATAVACSPHPPLTPFQMAVQSNSEQVARYFLFDRAEDSAQRTADGRTMKELAGAHVEVNQLLRAAKSADLISGSIDVAPSVGRADRSGCAGIPTPL
jgi:ankyrin repeat protein